MAYRDTASFGKRQEFIAVAELLKRDLDVYMTLVDDQQIDCIVRKTVRGKPVYLDIQIKARSGECNPQDAGMFTFELPKPRKNFFFIFYSEQACNEQAGEDGTYWVVPSRALVREAHQNKTGKHVGRYSIMLTNYSRKTERVTPRPRFEEYQGDRGFEFLSKYKG